MKEFEYWAMFFGLLACILLVAIWYGIDIENLKRNYVRRDMVEPMIYNIIANSQDRDDQVEWAQVQWLTRLHIKHFPKDKQWLAPYKRYWDMHDLDLWQRWELER